MKFLFSDFFPLAGRVELINVSFHVKITLVVSFQLKLQDLSNTSFFFKYNVLNHNSLDKSLTLLTAKMSPELPACELVYKQLWTILCAYLPHNSYENTSVLFNWHCGILIYRYGRLGLFALYSFILVICQRTTQTCHNEMQTWFVDFLIRSFDIHYHAKCSRNIMFDYIVRSNQLMSWDVK